MAWEQPNHMHTHIVLQRNADTTHPLTHPSIDNYCKATMPYQKYCNVNADSFKPTGHFGTILSVGTVITMARFIYREEASSTNSLASLLD